MQTELKIAIWQIANAAIEMYENKLNGKEFEELAINALTQVKNLNIPVVSSRNCINCNNCQTQYSNCRFDRYICDINKNFVTDPYHHGCSVFKARDHGR